MGYAGRPGISPALAALVATGAVRRGQRVLDVGCSTGTDALLLASWGFRSVAGIDPDARAIATARSRATRRRLPVRFERLGAEDLPGPFGRRHFDVVLHTLVANNLRDRLDEHFAGVASVLKPDGLLVLHERINHRDGNAAPGQVAPLPEVARRFRLTPAVTAHLAEAGGGSARVALWLGQPKRFGRVGQ